MSDPQRTLRAYREAEVEERVAARGAEGPSYRARLASSGQWRDWELILALDVDGRAIGEVQARNHPGVMPPGVFDLGIEIFDAADRGRGHGIWAIRAITDRLFREHEASRVTGSTDPENVAMRRTFESAGFTFEGTMRGFMPVAVVPEYARPGERYRDSVLYAITLDDWNGRR